MVAIARARVTWSGWSGGPGISTFFSQGAGEPGVGLVDELFNLFQGIAGQITSHVTLTIPSQGDIIESTTGALVGAWSSGTDKTVTGGYPGAMSLAQGYQIAWKTGTLHRGRHLRGRTFLVPSPSGAVGDDGLVRQDVVNPIQQQINASVGGTHTLGIWGRPTKGGSDGVFGPITAGTCPRMPVVLRSRRD